MSRLYVLQKQHEALLGFAGEITTNLALGPTVDRDELADVLERFDTVLVAHLEVEDKQLYPSMMALSDETASSLATQFSEEMGGLKQSYDNFAARWAELPDSTEGWNDFRLEWATLAAALTDRIGREEAELYPAAEAIGPHERLMY